MRKYSTDYNYKTDVIFRPFEERLQMIQKDYAFFIPLNVNISSTDIDDNMFEDDFIILNVSAYLKKAAEGSHFGGYFKNEDDAFLFKMMWV